MKNNKNNKLKKLNDENVRILSEMKRIYIDILEYERKAMKYRFSNKHIYDNMINIIRIKNEYLDELRKQHSNIFDKMIKIENKG